MRQCLIKFGAPDVRRLPKVPQAPARALSEVATVTGGAFAFVGRRQTGRERPTFLGPATSHHRSSSLVVWEVIELG
jgi:hypothetical protein